MCQGLAGENRYETTVEVAKGYKTVLKEDIDTVIIASGEDYPDSLASSPIATVNKAAILLTKSDKLNKYTKEYIENNDIKNIIIVGGENSVSKNVENELRNLN
ncbi:cell wall-binding repeat-containing protein [Peptostreptococcus faecalis]|uniref:cell wall-binding repeat-containing protein n=1 Tax=Peptostreptococcus faecalis TaxID=2045015 RepID=UPI000C7B4302|nr:cell wall-binding repeat-containing protein [Peptostreptococcus faecalis]